MPELKATPKRTVVSSVATRFSLSMKNAMKQEADAPGTCKVIETS